MKILKRLSVLALIILIIMSISALAVNADTGEYTNPFSDVSDGAWYADAVQYCVQNGFVNGITPTTFSPDNNLTRGQFVTLLANLDGVDLTQYTDVDSPFSDVTKGQWFYNAVVWAASNGYANGIGGGLYGPDDNVTRAQLARFFYIYRQKSGADVSAEGSLIQFSDANSVPGWAVTEIKWAVANGLINGMNGAINGDGFATRAQAARIMMLFDQLDTRNAYDTLVATLSPSYNYDIEETIENCYSYQELFDYAFDSEENSYHYLYDGVNVTYSSDYDILQMNYLVEEQTESWSEESSSSFYDTAFVNFWLFNGQCGIEIEFTDNSYDGTTETNRSYTYYGDLDGDNISYTVDYYGMSEEEAVQSAEMLLLNAWNVIDRTINNKCGVNINQVIADAPEKAPVGDTAFDKLFAEMRPVVSWYTGEIFCFYYDDILNKTSSEHTEGEVYYYSSSNSLAGTTYYPYSGELIVSYLDEVFNLTETWGPNGEYIYTNISSADNVVFSKDEEGYSITVYKTTCNDTPEVYTEIRAEVNVIPQTDGTYTYSVNIVDGMSEEAALAYAKAIFPVALEVINTSLTDLCGISVIDLMA